MPLALSKTGRLAPLLPGLALACAVSAASWIGAAGERRIFGHVVVDALVLAILVGMALRTVRPPRAGELAGVRFAAKEVLEVAVLLLGASVDLPLLLRAGPALAIGIVLLVVVGLGASYALGRALGLPPQLAVLVACGNSICGNSAIAAVAPVIDAEPEHVASAIAFTAILGVVVVVGLPLLVAPLGLSFYQYGVLAGLTVYAVPQVLAAAFPVSALSGQVGTLVKLMRVLMLGPVVLFFALRHRRPRSDAHEAGNPAPALGRGQGSDPGVRPLSRNRTGARRPGPRLGQLVPWFIVGFLLLAALRSAGLVPDAATVAARTLSGWLTILAMAALGLGVDLRAVSRVGRAVSVTVAGSLVVLVALSLALIHGLRLG